MDGECCRSRWRRIASLAALAASAAAAIFIPKCPLCLAAQLALLGAGIGLSATSPAALFGSAGVALALLALGVFIRRPRSPA